MSDLRELYQETILDHGKRPRNHRRPATFNHEADGHNPLCGDKIHVYLDLDEAGRVRDLSFEGKGCAISQASASMMTEALRGMPVAEAEKLYHKFHALLTTGEVPDADEEPELGKLEMLGGVREFPMRVKCATLAWHTFEAALRGEAAPVTTD